MLAGKIHAISQIYTQQTNLELEAKFGYYTDRGFDSNVPYIHFERLLNFLQSNVGNEIMEISTVRQARNIRQIIITNSGDTPQTVIWQRKYPVIQHIDLREYDIRVSINKEEPLRPDEIPTTFTPESIRDRIRRSFTLADGVVRVDLTQVMMTVAGRSRNRYEVELEFHGGMDQFHIFEQQIEILFKLLRGTNLIFTNTAKMQMIEHVNRTLGSTRPNMIDKDVLSEARNIKSRDLVYGGIVGNPQTNYIVTFKADGLRKMLIIHTTGIWMVYPPFEFNLVLDLTTNIPRLDTLLNQLNGTIFDGEWVQPKVQKEYSYWYLVFDCLSYRGSAAIQNSPYSDRRQIVDAIAGVIVTPILTLGTKDTYEIKTPDEFFTVVTDFLNRRDTLEYNEDGLMFFPAQFRYNPRTKDEINPITRRPYKLHERSLTRVPDICKWKEQHDITIDFALKWTQNGLELHSYDEEKKASVPFRGSAINPLTPEMIDSTNELTRDKPSDLVVEYEWINSTPAHPKGLFRPRRIRYDKSGPNRLEVALDDWEDIMNPITAEDIKGQTIKMTRSYFNRVKTDLYRTINKKFPNGANILDIGSGRGGDVSKWKMLTAKDRSGRPVPGTGIVVAVEPNESNRTELESRIRSNRMEDKVIVVPSGGQDTQIITQLVRQSVPGGKVDAVTLMLSMSFFWETDSNLDALVNTIVSNLKPGGIIVFLTIDGNVVEQIFEPALGGTFITDKRIVTADLHLHPRSTPPNGRALDFVLPDTIVGEQREYLVHLEDLSRRLSKYGIYLVESRRAEGEKLLSKENRLYSSMFSYGYYVNEDPTLLPQIATTERVSVTQPLDQPITLPVTQPLGQPITLPVTPPIPRPITQPITLPVPRPITQPITLPVPRPITQPITPPVPRPITQPITPPVPRPITQPITPPIPRPITQPITPPIPRPITQPITPPIPRPITQPITPPIPRPITQPITPPVPRPITQPITPPVPRPITQPITPPVPQPFGQPITLSVARPITQPFIPPVPRPF
jgi:SAM-dependent methyltransferase